MQEWLEATGHKKEIVDLEIAKHKKQWNFPTVQHSWAGLWTASTGHWLSPYLLSLASKTHQTYQTYQTHDNLLRLLDSFALCMPGKHRQHTTNQPTHKQQHSKINNNNKTTYKQQHTNISHSSKDPGEPLYNHAGHTEVEVSIKAKRSTVLLPLSYTYGCSPKWLAPPIWKLSRVERVLGSKKPCLSG